MSHNLVSKTSFENWLTVVWLQLLRDVPEHEEEEDAELQASIASANKWRKMVALTKQRAAEVFNKIYNNDYS